MVLLNQKKNVGAESMLKKFGLPQYAIESRRTNLMLIGASTQRQ